MPNFQKFGDVYVDMEMVATVAQVSSHALSLRTVSGDEIVEIDSYVDGDGYQALLKWLHEN